MDFESCSKSDLLCKIDDLQDELKEKIRIIETNTREITKHKDTISELRLHSVKEDEHQHLKAKYDSVHAKYTKLRDEANQLSKDNEQFRKANDNLYNQIKEQEVEEGTVNKLKRELESFQHGMEVISAANEELNAEVKAKEEEIAKYRADIETLKADYEQLKESIPRNRLNESLNISNVSSSCFDPNASVQEFSFTGGINVNRLPSFVGETVADMKIPILEQEKEDLQQKLNTVEANLIESKEINESLKNQLNEREIHIEGLGNILKSNQEQISSMTTENGRILECISQCEAKITLFIQEKEEMSRQMSTQMDTIEQLEANLTETQHKLVASEKSLTEKCTELFALHQTNDELTALKQNLEQQINNYNTTVEQLNNEIELKQATVKQLQCSLGESQKKIKSLNAQFDKKCLELEQSQSFNEELSRLNEDIEAKLNLLKIDNDELKKCLDLKHIEIAQFEADLKMTKASLSENVASLNAKSLKCIQLCQDNSELKQLINQHESKIQEQCQELSQNVASFNELQSRFERTELDLTELKSNYQQKCSAFDTLQHAHTELMELKDCVERNLADRDFTIRKMNEDISKMQSKLTLTETKFSDLQTLFESTSNDLVALKHKLEMKTSEHSTTVQSLTDELSKHAATIDKLELNFSDSERQLADSRNEISVLNELISNKQVSIELLETNLAKAEVTFTVKCEEFELLESKFADLTRVKETFERQFSLSNDQNDKLSVELENKNAIIEKYQTEISEMKSILIDQISKGEQLLKEINETQSKYDNIKLESDKKTEAIVQLENELSAVSDKLNDANLLNEKIHQELNELCDLKQSLQLNVSVLNSNKEQLESELKNNFQVIENLRSEYDQTKNSLSQLESSNQNTLAVLSQAIESRNILEQKLFDSNVKNDQFALELTQKDESIQTLQTELEQMRSKLSELHSSVDQTNQELVQLTESKLNLEQQLSEFRSKIEELNQSVEQRDTELATLKSCLSTAEDQFLRVNKQHSDQSTELVKLESLYRELNKSKKELVGQIELLKSECNSMSKERELTQSKLDSLHNKITKLEKESEEKRTLLDDYKKEVCLQMKQIDGYRVQLDDLNRILSDKEASVLLLNSQLTDSKAQETELNSQIKSLNQLITEKDSHIQEMESELRDSKSKFIDINGLLQESKQLEGVFQERIDNLTQTLSTNESSIHSLELKLTETKSELDYQIESLNRVTLQKDSIVQELEKQLEESKSKSIELAGLLKQQVDSFHCQIRELNQSISEKESSIQSLESNLADSSAQRSELGTQIASLNDAIAEKNALKQRLESQIELFKSNSAEMNEREQFLKQQIDDLRNQLTVLREDNANKQFRIEEMQSNLTEQRNAFEQKCAEMKQMEQQFNNELTNLMQQSANKDSTLNGLESRLRESEGQQSELKSQLERISNEFDQLSHKSNSELSILKEDFERQTNEFIQKQDEMQKVLHEKETLVGEYQAAVESLRNELTDQLAMEKNKDVIITSLSSSLEESESKVIEMQSQLDTKSIECEQLKSLETKLSMAEPRIKQLEQQLKQSQDKCATYKNFAEKFTKDYDALQKQVDDFKANKTTESGNLEDLQRQLQEKCSTNTDLAKQIRAKNLQFKKLQQDLDMEKMSFAMERKTKERLLKDNQDLELSVKKLERRLELANAEAKESSVCKKCRSGSSLMPEHFVVNVNTNLHHAAQVPQQVPHRLSNRFEMADEEGQFMDPNNIDSTQLFGTCPSSNSSFSSLPSIQQSKEDRIQQLIHRNSMLQPHLRSTYPIELQEMLNNIDENSIRSGSVSSLSSTTSVGTATTSLSIGRTSSVSDFQRPALPQTRSQTSLSRQVAQSIENVHNQSSSSSVRSGKQQTLRRPAPTSFSISTENLPSSGKKAKKESNTFRSTLTPSKILKRVLPAKRTWTPTKNKK